MSHVAPCVPLSLLIYNSLIHAIHFSSAVLNCIITQIFKFIATTVSGYISPHCTQMVATVHKCNLLKPETMFLNVAGLHEWLRSGCLLLILC